jgi:lysophospholipase L1-like esterase
MLKSAHIYRRIVVPIALVVLMLFAFAPAALAASNHSTQPNWNNGLKQHYLALGDSLAFGYQPSCKTTLICTHGYVNDLFQELQQKGVKDVTNLGCPGETSGSLISGGICAYPPPFTSQLAAALAYLTANAGNVSPVTLDIGANDVLRNILFTPLKGPCVENVPGFNTDLATLDANLTQVILPQLKAALTVNNRVTGKIVMMNYYDPFQNFCPETVPFLQTLNQHLAADVQGFGSIVNVFHAFGGPKTPNPNICTYTWMCTAPPLGPDIHATNKGYSVIADTFEDAIL